MMKKVFEQAKRNKAARAAGQAAQQPPEGVVAQRKGLFGLPPRGPMVPSKMMADMATQARANMPTTTGDVDAMMGRSAQRDMTTMKKGGKVKKMAKGGSTASKRADGCATQGKTKGRFV